MGVFLGFFAAFTSYYKFWSRPPEASSGLNIFVVLCWTLLFALQFFKSTRVISWWILPVMGSLTFLLFDPSENYGEFIYQIPIAAVMSVFAFFLTYQRKGSL
jgi:uncharacterized membrane protein